MVELSVPAAAPPRTRAPDARSRTLFREPAPLTHLRVHHAPAPIEPADLAVVIDVLRASTTIATALEHGARAIIPVLTVAEARRAAKRIGATNPSATARSAAARADALLAGERHALKVPGFDLGNSPREFTRARVEGRTVILTTTNGTAALLAAARGSRDVIVGSYVNFSVVLASVRSALRRGLDVAIVCAGSGGAFSLEDTACAGRFVRLALRGLPARRTTVLNDAARAALLIEKPYAETLARLFDHASHGRTLRDAGFVRDLAACRALDAHPVVPRLVGGELRARPARGRIA